jgi:nitrate/nitrite-specific signal transduction histidine kinase
VMSTDWARFHVASAQLGKQIDNQVNQTTTRAQQVGVVAGIVALCFAIFFALTIARPILRLTSVARQIERDEWDSVDLARLEQTRQHDELSRLTRVFASMAKEVHERIAGLRKQVQQLQVVIDESKREKDVQQIVESEFFRDLTGKAREMRAQRQRFNAPPAVPESDRPTGTEG